MRILFLDDQPVRHGFFAAQHCGDCIVHATDYDSAVDALAKNYFDEAYLDHDLGDFDPKPRGYGEPPELTGFDVAAYIVRMPASFRPQRCVIHSWNSDGAARMEKLLRDAGVEVSRQPFSVPKGLLPQGLWTPTAAILPQGDKDEG